MQSNFISNLSGRLCVRQTSEGCITVGVIHTPKSFNPADTEAFFMGFTQHGMTLIAQRVDHLNEPADQTYGGPPEQMSDLAMIPNWQDGEHMGGHLHTFRFSKVFEAKESNGFQVISCSKSDPFIGCSGFDGDNFKDGPHYLVDITAGAVSKAEHPMLISMQGNSLASIFRNYPIWPDAEKNLHTLPNLTHYGEEKMLKLHAINRNQLLGIISASEAGEKRWMLGEMKNGNLNDESYQKFLAVAINFNLVEHFKGPIPESRYNTQESKLARGHIIAHLIHNQQPDSDDFYEKLRELSNLLWQPFIPHVDSPTTGLKMGFDIARLNDAAQAGYSTIELSVQQTQNNPIDVLSKMAAECVESGDPDLIAQFTQATYLTPTAYLEHKEQIASVQKHYVLNQQQNQKQTLEHTLHPKSSIDGPCLM